MANRVAPLPSIFPAPGSRVIIPDPESKVGGTMRTWTMGEAREVDGGLKIRCAGAGWVPVAKVRIA